MRSNDPDGPPSRLEPARPTTTANERTSRMSISLADLGLEPIDTIADGTVTSDSGVATPDAIPVGSALARALYHTWTGDRAVIIESPPGAGKTTLITQLVKHLLERSELGIVVACPTVRGMADLATRLVETLGDPDDNPDAPVVIFNHKRMDPPKGTRTINRQYNRRAVIVRTVASCAASPPPVDLLIFDEAFQTTYATAMKAARTADQILMVGDPGQIGPVNKVPTGFWDNGDISPADRAPEAFAKLPDAITIHMDTTYRIGQSTVDVIAPMYGFEFTSQRPDRAILDTNGNRLGEIESVQVDEASHRANLDLMGRIARHAVSFIGKTARDYHPDGTHTDTTITASDVAVVVPHNDQAETIGAIINSLLGTSHLTANSSRVYVGTADRAQGGQWKAVVAVDPMVAHTAAGGYQLALGRLCVMLSRHTHHMTWVHDGLAEERFADIADDPEALPKAADEARRNIAVRRLVNQYNHGRALA